MIGSWLALVGDDAGVVLRVLDDVAEEEPADAVSLIERRLRRLRDEMKGSPEKRSIVVTPAAAERVSEAAKMVERGEWPRGGSVFVRADSDEGAAWAAYYAHHGRRARWMDLGREGFGWHMPSAMPPVTPALSA